MNSLTITVSGSCEQGSTIKVNGVAAQVSGTSFSATISLTEGQNMITATATDAVNNTSTLSDTNNDGKNDQMVVTVNSGCQGYYNLVIMNIYNTGNQPIAMSQVKINNNGSIKTKLLASPESYIQPGRRCAVGIGFYVTPDPASNCGFTVGLTHC